MSRFQYMLKSTVPVMTNEFRKIFDQNMDKFNLNVDAQRVIESIAEKAENESVYAVSQAEAAKGQSQTAEEKANTTQTQLSTIVREQSEGGDVATEVYQTRVGVDGTEHTTSGERLSAEYQKNQGDIQANVTRTVYVSNDVISARVNVLYPPDELEAIQADNTTDDSAALQAIADYCRTNKRQFFVPRGTTIRIVSEVNLVGVLQVQIEGRINVDYEGIGLVIGHTSVQAVPSRFFLFDVSGIGQPSVRVQGIKNTDLIIQNSNYVQFYADETSSTTDSSSYSNFNPGKIDKLEFYEAPGFSWITELNIYGGRFKDIRLGNPEAEYYVNNVIFYKPCVENGDIYFVKANRNKMYDVRSEGGTKLHFQNKSGRNVITDNYISHFGRIDGSFTIVEDNGRENMVVSSMQQTLTRVPLAILDKHAPVFEDGGGFNFAEAGCISPGITSLQGRDWHQIFRLTLPVTEVKRFGFYVTGESPELLRMTVRLFDGNGNQLSKQTEDHMILDNKTNYYVESDGSDPRYIIQTNTDQSEFFVLDQRAEEMEWLITFGPNATIPFDQLVVYAEANRKAIDAAESMKEQFQAAPWIARNDLRYGHAKKGTQIVAQDRVYHCIKDLETKANNRGAGASDITVHDATGISVGDHIGIEDVENTTLWNKVTGVNSNILTLENALVRNVLVDALVKVNRFLVLQ